MKRINQIKKVMFLMTTGMLSGCFESPSSPASSSVPSDIKPLKHTTSEPFNLPEGVTEIQSAFSESDTKDWGNSQNWTSSFYKDGESVGYDHFKFVPCRAQKPDLPTRITIYEGTCFVNENVELSGLEMVKDTRLTIPEGVSVKSIANFDLNSVTIDGGGDFYVTGKPIGYCNGNIKLNKFHAPEVSWGGLKAIFEVNQAKLHYLGSGKIRVKDRLDVSELSFNDTMEVFIHRLHITRSDSDLVCLTFCTLTHPLNIDHLSFDPGTRIEAYRKDEHLVYKSATWQPIRLTGTLDVTHMNPVRAASFEPEGAIGEKIPVIIAEKGIVGDPNILRRHRRCVVSGYFSDFNKEYMKSYGCEGTSRLLWVDGTQLYWQRSVSPWMGGRGFLLSNDDNFMKLAQANRNTSYGTLLGIGDTTMKQVEQICNALSTQSKYIHDHATEAGIERYLEVLITPNAKDRVHKLLALADIQPHLNEHNVLSETGELAVIDSLGYFNSPLADGYYGLTTVNPSCMSPTATNIGLSLNTPTYKVSGAFHQTHATAQSPWTLGVEYRSKLSSRMCGVLRTLGDGIDMHPISAQLKGGIGYMLSSISNVTVFAGTKGLLGKKGTETTHSKALPTSTIYSLDTGIEWSTCLKGHVVRVGGDISYRPNQTVAVRIADLGATVDGLTLKSSYTFKGMVGYTYTSINGIQWVGDLSLTIGDRVGISANIGVNLER